MGDGGCSFMTCNCIESIEHLFWYCPKVRHIISWASKMFYLFVDNNCHFNLSFFLYGFPEVILPKNVFNRLWFILCACKWYIWKSRCIHVFQSILHPDHVFLSLIVKHIKGRVFADKLRLSDSKFRNMWIKNRSFVSIHNNNLVFKLD